MFHTNHTAPAFTPFGGGYVREQRSDDETFSNLATHDVVASLRVSFFDEVLKSLRSTLALGRL